MSMPIIRHTMNTEMRDKTNNKREENQTHNNMFD